MNSGIRILLKVLIAVVSYGVAFALAFYAFSQLIGDETTPFVWVILVILAICGYRAIKHLPFLFVSSSGTASIPVNLFLLFLRVLLSVFAGVFIAPWMIAKKLGSLIPGEAGGAAEEEQE